MPSHSLIETQLVYARHKTLRGQAVSDTHHTTAPPFAQSHTANAIPAITRPGSFARSHIASEAHLPRAPRFPRGQIANATHGQVAPGSILSRAIRQTKPMQASPCDLAGATRSAKPKLHPHRILLTGAISLSRPSLSTPRLCFNGSKRTSRTSLAPTRVLPLFQYPAVDPFEMRGVAG